MGEEARNWGRREGAATAEPRDAGMGGHPPSLPLSSLRVLPAPPRHIPAYTTCSLGAWRRFCFCFSLTLFFHTPPDAHGEAKVAYPWQAPTDPASWKEEHVVFTVLAGWVVGIWSATKIFGGGKKEAPLMKATDASAQQAAVVAAAVKAAPAAVAAAAPPAAPAPAVVTSAAVSEPVPAAPAAGQK